MRRLLTGRFSIGSLVLLLACGVSKASALSGGGAFFEMIQSPAGVTGTPSIRVSPDGTTAVIMQPGGPLLRWSEGGSAIEELGQAWGDVKGISGNGSLVVGGDKDRGWYWTPGSGLRQYSGFAPSNLGGAKQANAVSRDGSTVIGTRPSSTYEALAWSANGTVMPLGTLGSGYVSAPIAVSADGSVIVGAGNLSKDGSEYQPFRWTRAAGMQPLGNVPGGAIPTSISSDGRVVLSEARSGGELRWTEKTGFVSRAGASAGVLSADGSTVASNDSATSLWREDGVQLLPTPPTGPNGHFEPMAISADGSAVVENDLTRASWYHQDHPIWVSDAQHGMEALDARLAEFGVNVPATDGNDRTLWVTGASDDARTIVGIEVDWRSSDHYAWIARVPDLGSGVVPEPWGGGPAVLAVGSALLRRRRR
jgi:hypothetical protein